MTATVQNETVEVFASGTRSGSNSADVELPYHRGLIVVVDVTATSGDGTEDLDIQLRSADPVTGNTHNLIQDSIDNGATETRWYLVYPGVSDTQSAYDVIEESPAGRRVTVRLETLQGGTSPDHTYSVGALKLL